MTGAVQMSGQLCPPPCSQPLASAGFASVAQGWDCPVSMKELGAVTCTE